MQKSLVLLQNHIEILINHAKKNTPNESCAILFGRINNEKFEVIDIFLTENIEGSPVEFSLSPEDVFKVYSEAEKRKLELGIFHSHPDSNAYPSSTDTKFMEINPYPWVIFSSKNEEFKAYIFVSRVIPISLEIR